MQPGVSTARLAREHGINDNLLFNWRNLYKQGRLGPTLPAEPCLLPVELEDVPSPPPIPGKNSACRPHLHALATSCIFRPKPIRRVKN